MKIKVEDLKIEEKIGQMFMIGMDIPNVIEKIDDLILKHKIGGILLYRKNYNNYKELVELINYIKKLNTSNKIPLFIAVDQEGGRVNRMPKEFSNIPSAFSLAQCKDLKLIKKSAEITGKMLNGIGINFNFAPVLDLKRFKDNQAIGDRAFSDNPEEVSKYGIEYFKELQKQNVIPVIKHFPGHGTTEKDTHFMLPTIKDIDIFEKKDMLPFENAIKQGADVLLVSHIKVANQSNKYPFSMSKKLIHNYIREKYNYKGIIITDDMRMKGVELRYGKNRPILKAFEAGNDIIVCKYRENDKIIEKTIEKVKSGKIKEEDVNISVQRILDIKNKYNVNGDEIEFNEDFAKEINEEIENIKNRIKKN